MKNLMCDWCDRLFDKPSIGCKYGQKHREPDFAQKVAHFIEKDLRGRSGMDWGGVHDEIQQEIRETWAEIVREQIRLI